MILCHLNSSEYPEDPAAHLDHAGFERTPDPDLLRHTLPPHLQLLCMWYVISFFFQWSKWILKL